MLAASVEALTVSTPCILPVPLKLISPPDTVKSPVKVVLVESSFKSVPSSFALIMLCILAPIVDPSSANDISPETLPAELSLVVSLKVEVWSSELTISIWVLGLVVLIPRLPVTEAPVDNVANF